MSGRALFGDEDPWARAKTSDGEVDMTAMIDCTFLLLIFFMVCSTMQRQLDIDLPIALHSVGVETPGAAIVTIRAGTPTTGPQILLGDGVGEEATIDDIRRFVSEAVTAGKANIVVKAEGDVSQGFLEDVVRQISAVEGAKLYVGVGDQPD